MAKRQDDPTPMTKATERQGSPLQLKYNSHCILIDGRHSVLDKSNGCLTGSRYNPQYHHHHQQEVGHHEPDWFHHGGFMRSARCAISKAARRWPSWRHSDGLNCYLRHHAAATAVDAQQCPQWVVQVIICVAVVSTQTGIVRLHHGGCGKLDVSAVADTVISNARLILLAASRNRWYVLLPESPAALLHLV